MRDEGSLQQRSHPLVVLPAPEGWDVAPVPAKLSRPEVPPGYVDRPRLHQVLDLGTRGELTTVIGGPGWGKTLLVASWAAQVGPGRVVAWLTLDADDDDPRAFWTYVLAALRTSGAVRPESTLATLDLVGGLTTDTYRRIQVGLSELSREVVLVIDDVSEVVDDEVHEQIARLFQHESPLRTVLVTRVEPPLPLHRLRVGGDLTEIGAEELAFTADEARDLLVGHGVGAGQDDLAHLLDRTAGWAAGLRLAAMFLQRPGARAVDFGGSDRAVADYLLGEVAAAQSPQTWQFLLRTSLVPHICGDLADTLTGQAHGQATLDALERENAFVTALGPQRRWYRYHPLLAEMLQRQLELERPESIAELHERAAGWFAANGRPVDAVRHAVAARNWPLAGTLLTRVALHRLQTSDRHMLAALLAQIPTAELGRTAELQVCAAALLMVEGRFVDIGPHLAVARAMLDEQEGGEDPSTSIAVSLFESAHARAMGSAAATLSAATRALRTLDLHGSAVPLARECRAVALNNRGVGQLWLGDLDGATASLEAGLEASRAAGVELTEVNALGYLGLAAAVTGHLRRAADLAGQCLSLAQARGWATLQQAANGYVGLALVSIARNDLDAADRMVSLGLDTQRHDSEPLTLAALRLAQAGVDTARGRPDDARSQLAKVRESSAASGPAGLVHELLESAEAEVDLLSGAASDVHAPLAATDPGGRSDAETLRLARARLADGEARDLHDLGRLLAPVVRQRRNLSLAVQAFVVHALAADRLRLDNEALAALGRALALAEPEQLLAPFTGPGTARLHGLLEHVVLLQPAHAAFARTLLDRPAPTPFGRMASTAGTAGASVDQVTERERTVLRYLATMLSNAEIAEQMFLSPNTVKVHLRHVYRKLDVTSRRAAVRRARELGLLDDDDST